MAYKLREILILSAIFGIIYWFQTVDDKKRCKERKNIYEHFKLPVLVTSISALIMFWGEKSYNTIFIANDCPKNISLVNNNNNQINELLAPSIANKNFSDFDVYTSLPEW
jgi:hypothetical protein